MKEYSRTTTWKDPNQARRDVASMSGLEHLEAIRDGRMDAPPVAGTVGYRIVEVSSGRAVFELATGPWLYNPFSTVHGGILSTLLDTAMTAAVMSTLEKGRVCTTSGLKIDFVRPVTEKSGPVQAEGLVLHGGKGSAHASGKLVDAAGKLCVLATSTCRIFSV